MAEIMVADELTAIFNHLTKDEFYSDPEILISYAMDYRIERSVVILIRNVITNEKKAFLESLDCPPDYIDKAVQRIASNCSADSIRLGELVRCIRGCISDGTEVEVADHSTYVASRNVLESTKVQFHVEKTVESFEIPDYVKELEWHAFDGCKSLREITIPDTVIKIGWYAFNGCISLHEVAIPDSVTEIGCYAFSGCKSIREMTIPDSVRLIGSHAFSGCTSLRRVIIPDSVETIGGRAFKGCTSLREVVLPDSVIDIGSSAFEGCTSLNKANGFEQMVLGKTDWLDDIS